MARLPIIAGNWKMNGDSSEAVSLCKDLAAQEGGWPKIDGQPVEVAVFPPYISLAAARENLAGSGIILGAQNMHEAESGAFTGEISGSMLLTAGCRMVILGHSERRQFFGETDAGVNRKALAALTVGLRPIVCVGETLGERDSNRAFEVIENQLAGAFKGFTETQFGNVVVAYEPVWAIGTGRVATVEQAGEIHRFIREWLEKNFGQNVSESMRIQYGGSVKPDNAATLLAVPDIDGALVGGASLKADQFGAIISAAQQS